MDNSKSYEENPENKIDFAWPQYRATIIGGVGLPVLSATAIGVLFPILQAYGQEYLYFNAFNTLASINVALPYCTVAIAAVLLAAIGAGAGFGVDQYIASRSDKVTPQDSEIDPSLTQDLNLEIVVLDNAYPAKAQPIDLEAVDAFQYIPIKGETAVASMMGSTFTEPGKNSTETTVLDASLVSVRNDKKAVYGAIADGCGHSSNEEEQNNIARASKAAVRIAIEKISTNTQPISSIELINQISDEVQKEVDADGTANASLCYYKAETTSNNTLHVDVVNVGDCMLVGYSPSRQQWTTLAPANRSNPCVGGGTINMRGKMALRTYEPESIYKQTHEELPIDTIIIGMTDGVHDYLPTTTDEKGLRKIWVSLDSDAMNTKLQHTLQAGGSDITANQLLTAVRNLAITEQQKQMAEDKEKNEVADKYGDDFTAHAIQPAIILEKHKTVEPSTLQI